MNKRINVISDILANGKEGTWKWYGDKYNEHPEKIRKWWRMFKDDLVFKGLLTPSDKMNEDQLDQAYESGLMVKPIITPRYCPNDTILPPIPDDEDEYIELPSAWDSNTQTYLTIEEYCDKYGLDKDSVKSCKLVGHNPNHMVYNIVFKPTIESLEIDSESIEDIIKRAVLPISRENRIIENSDWVDRLVYTDTHINMNPNGFSGSPLYAGKWGRGEVFDRLEIMIDHTITYQKSNYLIISELGDFLDGFKGETVRGGHKLPQNTSDKEAFDLGLEFKIKIVSQLLENYDYIYSSNCVNNNHAGDFDYFVNTAAKEALERMFPGRVEVHNRTRFIDHYKFGKHTFIESHGKDMESLKFGFKPFLDPKQAEKIDQYCKEYNLYDGNFIEFGKGDSHLNVFDSTSSNDFHYFSYPAFSPPSQWVKVNFKNSKSGFYFFNIDKKSQIKIHNPYFF